MVRPRLISLLCLAGLSYLISGSLLGGDPPQEAVIQNTLALQQAMEQAKESMRQGDAAKAVEILEEQLARVNGNGPFLRMLREAYRVYIKDLWIANKGQLATRYLERLCILEPAAANDPTLRPPQTTEKILPPPIAKNLGLPKLFPNFALNHLKKDSEGAAGLPKPSAVRAKPDDPAKNDDPFAMANMRAPAKGSDKAKLALELVLKAEDEFSRRRYTQARALFEQAYRADPGSLGNSKDPWAYCILHDVTEQLNRPGAPGPALADLQLQVQAAMGLTPNPKVVESGTWLLREIDGRQKTQVAAATPEPAPTIVPQHLGRNSQGWQVVETKNFLIFHNQARELAEKVALVAEKTRLDMFRKWFGADGEPWTPKCELILHATAGDYSRQTGVPATSPGHSRIESDPSGQRVIGRRMDLRCDNPGMLEAILPHETTHVVLAGQFGNHQVPRWADEGIAVLTEPAHKVEQHRRNLQKSYQDGLLFGVKELMQLQDYPQPRRISAFYAQSVCLVEFLAELRGPQAFTAFLRDGLKEGYEPAVQKHFGMDMNELHQRWQQRVGGNRVAGAFGQ